MTYLLLPKMADEWFDHYHHITLGLMFGKAQNNLKTKPLLKEGAL